MIILPGQTGFEQCVAALQAGSLIGLPTETVYGLAGDATHDQAVAKIYETKGRPAFNPLIIHVENMGVAENYAEFNQQAAALASVFWPGPLTLVLNRKMDKPVSLLALAGLSTIALRVPAHPIAQAILKQFGKPVAAPSANKSGQLSPTSPAHVMKSFEGEAQPQFVLAGGRSEAGLESTIVDVTGDQAVLLRPGTITKEEIENVIGPIDVSTGDPDKPSAPGQTLRHYAPRLPLRLNAADVKPNEALLSFGVDKFIARGAKESLNLSANGDLREAAANLFHHLHTLDQPQKFSGIAVMAVPNIGLGIAINDRLARAADTGGRHKA